METKDLNIICKKYGCLIDVFGNVYIFKEKWIKIGKIYYKPKNSYFYPQNIHERNLGGDKNFETCLKVLLSSLNYI